MALVGVLGGMLLGSAVARRAAVGAVCGDPVLVATDPVVTVIDGPGSAAGEQAIWPGEMHVNEAGHIMSFEGADLDGSFSFEEKEP